jgi:hypothetical protein
MESTVLGLIVVVIVLAMTAAWIYALVDVLRTNDSAFAAAGQNKIMWLVLIIFLGLIGAVLYLAIARPKLSTA